MASFTEEQTQAIRHREGPMLVLAGPGSGKTTVITQRIRYLTTECGIMPGNILVITFTKAAAEEMESRYQAFHVPAHGRVNFGTFHAVFFKILKLAYHYDGTNILKEEERFRILQELVRTKVQQDFSDEKELVEAIASEISMVKNERFQLSGYYSVNCPAEVFREIFQCYEAELLRQKKLDFDDMLVHCYRLLSERKDILAMWQDKYRYILVDEFQDINRLQYDIVRMLAKPEDNLFIVGDDDQSIYSFRGARPELMLAFTKDYPQAKRVTLSCNFRSTAPIVASALRLIEQNKTRFPKDLYAFCGEGEPVEIRQYPERRRECAELAEEIAVLHKTGLPWREIAVLYRTNLQTRSIMGRFMEYNIPFRTREQVPNMYEHWVCQDIVAYLRMAQGARDRSLLLRIMNRPKRYLSREALSHSTVDFEELKQYYQEKDYVVDRIEKLSYDLSMLHGLNPFAAIHYIRRVIGYDSFLTEYAIYRKMSVEDLFDLLSELSEDAAEYATFEQWFAHMEEYKEQLSAQRRREQKDADAVMLTTYHSAKGLEFHTVFLPELNEEMTPYRHAVQPADIEEERRMFYVAMTRAKRRLVLSYLKELRMKSLVKSRFLRELSECALKEGTKVVHKVYGAGTVVGMQEESVSIRFEENGVTRRLNLAYCLEHQLLQTQPFA